MKYNVIVDHPGQPASTIKLWPEKSVFVTLENYATVYVQLTKLGDEVNLAICSNEIHSEKESYIFSKADLLELADFITALSKAVR